MKEYKEIIKTILVAFLIGGLLIFWGIKNDGIIRIILGILIIIVFIKNSVDHYKYIVDLKAWLLENNGRPIFFYATTKDIQKRIETEVLPLLPKDCLKVYYDGPKLVGDIKRSVTVELMNQYKDIKVNSPSIFKVLNDKLYIETLLEMKDVNASLADLNSIKTKIDKVANA